MRIVCLALIALGLCAEARADDGDSSTARHLLAGVRAFKAERYEEALVELRVVARAADVPEDLAFYLGPTLYKLARYHEALEVFVTSRAAPDALTLFYLGETYYQLKLYRKARLVFGALRAQGLGPTLDEAAGRYVAMIDAAYRSPPSDAAIDYYLADGSERAGAAPAVACEVLDEARRVEALAARRHRHAEIVDAFAIACSAARRWNTVLEALSAERTLSQEGSWQLAHAYARIGDVEHARPLLDAIVKLRGPHASDAEALLGKQSPP